MSLTDGNNGMYMPVAPAYGYGGGFGGGFGGWDSSIWLILIVLFACGGFGGFGGVGGFGGNYEFPWLLNGQNGINANTNAGFNQAATASQLSGIQTSLTNGFSNAEVAACNRAMDSMQAAYNNQIASMNQNFANQQALDARLDSMAMAQQNCCCENRLQVANLGSDIAREACADRAAVSDALRDVIAANTASTQRILDQMCNDKIDAKNEKIAELQNQLNMATLRESQVAQNAFISKGFANEVDQLYNRLNSCPVPSTPVFGRTPIFQCNNNGCGCGYGI